MTDALAWRVTFRVRWQACPWESFRGDAIRVRYCHLIVMVWLGRRLWCFYRFRETTLKRTPF